MGKETGRRGFSTKPCHQCRQSIRSRQGMAELKRGKKRFKCSQCIKVWCETCLLNRYGLNADLVKKQLRTWSCPVCEMRCNCSLCRKKAVCMELHALFSKSHALDVGKVAIANALLIENHKTLKLCHYDTHLVRGIDQRRGKRPTGILLPSIKRSGFKNVAEFLDTATTEDVTKMLPKAPPTPPPPVPAKPLPPGVVAMVVEEEKFHKPVVDDENSSPKTRSFSTRRKGTNKPIPIIKSLSFTPSFTNYANGFLMNTEFFSLNEEVEGFFVEAGCFYVTPSSMKKLELDGTGFNVSVQEDGSACSATEVVEVLEIDQEDGDDDGNTCTTISEQMLNVFVKLSKVDYDCLIDLTTLYPHEEDESCITWYLSDKELDKLIQHEADGFIYVKPTRHQLRKVKVDFDAEENAGTRDELRNPFISQVFLEDIESKPLLNDSPEACILAGIPPLPSLSSWPLPLPSTLIPPFLFLSEFLCTFHTVLELKSRVDAPKLHDLLVNQGDLIDIYKRLLKPLITDGTLVKDARSLPRTQEKLERLALDYLQTSNDDGILKLCKESKLSVQDHITILSDLCRSVLKSGTLEVIIEDAQSSLSMLVQEQCFKEMEKCRTMGAELKCMFIDGGASLEKVEVKKRVFLSSLKKMRKAAQLEQLRYSRLLELRSLGEDRHGRKYWRFQSMAGVVIGAYYPGPAAVEQDTSIEQWFVLDSEQLLRKFIDSLHPSGRREKQLLQSLQLLEEEITQSFIGN